MTKAVAAVTAKAVRKRELLTKLQTEEREAAIAVVRAHLEKDGYKVEERLGESRAIPTFCFSRDGACLGFGEIYAGRDMPEWVKVDIGIFRGGCFCTEHFGFPGKDNKTVPVGFVVYLVVGGKDIHQWNFKRKRKEYPVLKDEGEPQVCIPRDEFRMV